MIFHVRFEILEVFENDSSPAEARLHPQQPNFLLEIELSTCTCRDDKSECGIGIAKSTVLVSDNFFRNFMQVMQWRRWWSLVINNEMPPLFSLRKYHANPMNSTVAPGDRSRPSPHPCYQTLVMLGKKIAEVFTRSLPPIPTNFSTPPPP